MDTPIRINAKADGHKIEPKTYEEAMEENARLKLLVKALECEGSENAVGVFIDPDPKAGFRVVICAPSADELTLAIDVRHALAALTEAYLNNSREIVNAVKAMQEAEKGLR